MNERAQNITFTEMREMGVRGVLLVCGDYKCSHSIARPRVPAGDRLAQTPPSRRLAAAVLNAKRGTEAPRQCLSWVNRD
jgi:hypothetical protein